MKEIVIVCTIGVVDHWRNRDARRYAYLYGVDLEISE